MELRIIKADPAGNVTLLVETAVPEIYRSACASALLSRKSLGGEQVGFLTEPRMGGSVRLEMMGGEFCGNAARSVGYRQAVLEGVSDGAFIPVEISGCSRVLPVEVFLSAGTAWTEVPLPEAVEPVLVGGRVLPAVRMEGILHLIADGKPLPDAEVRELLPQIAAQRGAPAVGILFLNGDTMIPAVYVAATDSLYWEKSCASGSAAAAFRMGAGLPDGVHRGALREPGGTIETELTVRDGRTVRVRIGGSVTLSEPRTVTI